MRRLAALALIVCLGALSSPVLAQTTEERTQLAWVSARGKLLFDLDRAAWVGTDDMLSQIRDPAGAGLRGFFVERDGDGYVVIFFAGPEEAPVAFYRGRVEDHRVVSRQVFDADARPPLTLLQRRLAAVRGMAAQLGRRPCGNGPFNTAVIPPDTPDGPIDLYLLTPQLRQSEVPLGGHYRFTIAADGSVVSSREFTRSCISLESEAEPKDGRPVALFVTHLLDQVPTEIHVFSSLVARLPIFVDTSEPRRLWWVSGERIELRRD